MTNKIHKIISEEEIADKVSQLAVRISSDYKKKKPLIICIMKGSAIFTSDLTRKLTINAYIDFISISRYKNKTKGGELQFTKDLDYSIEGMDVIIVEDIIDEGITLKCLKEELEKRNPASLKLCTLFDKPKNRSVDIEPDYKGFILPDKFVFGYGMDYKQRLRNLPYLAVYDN